MDIHGQDGGAPEQSGGAFSDPETSLQIGEEPVVDPSDGSDLPQAFKDNLDESLRRMQALFAKRTGDQSRSE